MFLLNKCTPMGTEDAPTAGVLRMSISTAQCCRPRPVSLPVPPVNLAICPDTAQFHVQEEPFLSSYTFSHIHSFRSFMKFRCCGMNFEHNKHKTFNLNILILWDSSDLQGEMYVTKQLFQVTWKREDSKGMER